MVTAAAPVQDWTGDEDRSASSGANKPVTEPEFLDPPLNLWEMRFATLHAGANSAPSVRRLSIRRGLSSFSDDVALSYVNHRRAQSTSCLKLADKMVYGAASLLYRSSVARISRLIGNSDTTAKPFLWQGASWGGIRPTM